MRRSFRTQHPFLVRFQLTTFLDFRNDSAQKDKINNFQLALWTRDQQSNHTKGASVDEVREHLTEGLKLGKDLDALRKQEVICSNQQNSIKYIHDNGAEASR